MGNRIKAAIKTLIIKNQARITRALILGDALRDLEISDAEADLMINDQLADLETWETRALIEEFVDVEEMLLRAASKKL